MELPSTHRLVRLCEDIYAMRAAKEFALEERLYCVDSSVPVARGALRVYQDDAGDAMPERPRLIGDRVVAGGRYGGQGGLTRRRAGVHSAFVT